MKCSVEVTNNTARSRKIWSGTFRHTFVCPRQWLAYMELLGKSYWLWYKNFCVITVSEKDFVSQSNTVRALLQKPRLSFSSPPGEEDIQSRFHCQGDGFKQEMLCESWYFTTKIRLQQHYIKLQFSLHSMKECLEIHL